MSDETISFRPKKEFTGLKKRLTRLASLNKRNFSEYLQVTLSDHCDKEEKKRYAKRTCDVCGSHDLIEAPHMGINCNRCNPL